MQSSNITLDKPLNQCFIKNRKHIGKLVAGEPAFGIEVELENCLQKDSPWFSDLWTFKGENSLRNNGMEFVSHPALYKNREKVCREFKDVLKKCIGTKPQLSIRCSTHIHMNAMYLTLRQIVNTSLVWYLLENAIIKTQSDWRQGNLFCLRMSDARTIGDNLIDSIWDPDRWSSYHTKNGVKYSAFNLAPTVEFGTMEWRFLSPITDPDLLIFWVEVFQSIIDYGATIKSPDALLQDYNNLDVKAFFKKIFGGNGKTLYEMVLNAHDGKYDGITQNLHKNYDFIVEAAGVLRSKKFEVFETLWCPDTASPELLAMQVSDQYIEATDFD